MASFGNSPNPWGSSSYDTYKDCSQGLCSIYCPQWCYLIFPPPPPMFGFENDNSNSENDNDTSASDFSPLIIAVIGILASAFILLSYYTLVSKYCRRHRSNDSNAQDPSENDNGIENDASFSSEGVGERVIKSIKVYKYKRGDGFVDGTDCSVCLSEFEENEGLRLLPKCNHAFHAPCIDTWLKSHTSCPLCRSDIAAATEDAPSVTTTAQRQLVVRSSEAVVVVVDAAAEESGASVEVVIGPKMRDIPSGFGSESGRISVADILSLDEDEDEGFDSVDRMESGVAYGCFGSVGTSSINNHDDCDHDGDRDEERSKLGRSGTHGLLRSPLAMTRSMSTGGYMFAKGELAFLSNESLLRHVVHPRVSLGESRGISRT